MTKTEDDRGRTVKGRGVMRFGGMKGWSDDEDEDKPIDPNLSGLCSVAMEVGKQWKEAETLHLRSRSPQRRGPSPPRPRDWGGRRLDSTGQGSRLLDSENSNAKPHKLKEEKKNH